MTDNDPNMQADFSGANVSSESGARRLWNDWPTCPGCENRRMTNCPGCGEASEEFRLAPYQSQGAEPPPSSLPILDLSEDDRYPLLVCPTCDDHFRPQFYQQCAWCGHEFGDGQRLGAGEREVEPEMTSREWWTIWGLAALALGGLIWFLVVLKR